MNSSALATFANKRADLVVGLILEQTPWSSNIGVVTKEVIIKKIQDLLAGFGADKTGVDCGMDAIDKYSSLVVAYLYDRDLVYDIGISSGTLSEQPLIFDKDIIQTVDFNMTTSAPLDYPAHSEVSIVWQQGPWDEDGGEISSFVQKVTGNALEVNKKLNGTATLTYKTVAHSYGFTITADDGVEDRFKSVAWARWDGGVEHIELKAPPNADEALDQGIKCYDIVKIEPNDPFVPPTVTGSDEVEKVDYCSGTYI